MALGKQARIITPEMERTVLLYLSTTRWSARDTAIFLLSIKAGLRAKEIASLKWRMILNSDGTLSDEIRLENKASKGKNGGRKIPMSKDLKSALEALLKVEKVVAKNPNLTVIQSERGGAMDNKTITNWFLALYRKLGMDGCSSHSGRRTFITRIARNISLAGGSIEDVRDLAGHSSLQTTQLYIDANPEAKRKVVDLN